MLEASEVVGHAASDEHPEAGQEFTLLPEVGLTRLPDDIGDVRHRAVDGERPRLQVLPPSVDGREGADDQAEPQDLMAGERTIEERRFRQVGDSDVRFAGAGEGGEGQQ